jgi:carboxyl-terminal processing protease
MQSILPQQRHKFTIFNDDRTFIMPRQHQSDYIQDYMMLKKSLFRAKLAMLAVAIFSASVFSTARLRADELGSLTASERQASIIVTTLMEQQHFSTHPLNDEISERALNLYLESLDPMKVYFTKSDIEEWSKEKTMLDDFAKAGNYNLTFKIFNRFLERVDQRVDLAIELADKEHDFTVDEDLITDRDAIDYVDDDGAIQERWRKRIKYNLLLFKGEEDSTEDPRERLKKRFTSFKRRMHQYSNDDVIEMYLTSITNAFDPHTSYMSKTSYKNFMIQMSLELDGIGATLQSTDDGLTQIKRIVPEGAAAKHGELQIDDKIVAVGQDDDGEMVDITDMKLDDVVQMIRGKAGTKVRLKVLRPKSNEIKTVAIVRERISLKDSEAKGKVFTAGKKADGSDYKVGVIDLPSFYSEMGATGRASLDAKSTTKDVSKILDEFNAANVDGVILDLRSNGGGSLQEAIDCTGLFIDRGPVVQVKKLTGDVEALNDEKSGMKWDGPLVVLTSKFSASASEILAGAVQDYHRGLVVGDSATHGKGTVQNLLDLNMLLYNGVRNPPSTYGALKITTQQFYRPNGDSTQLRGVLADIVLPSITDYMDVSESDLEFPVKFDRVASAEFQTVDMVNKDLVNALKEKSDARRQQSEEFASQMQSIERYQEQKKRKSVTLNEEEFFARRKEFNAEKTDEETIEKQVNNTSDDIERNFYLDEVINITVDYLKALPNKKVAKR